MNNFLGFLALGVIGILLQSTFLAYLGLGILRLELMILIITYLALYHPLVRGCFCVSILGYLYDLHSASPLALHWLSFLTVFLALNLTRDQLYLHGPAFGVGLSAFMVFFHYLVSSLVLASQGVSIWTGFAQFLILIPMSLLTGCLWPPASRTMRWLDQRFPFSHLVGLRRTSLEFRM